MRFKDWEVADSSMLSTFLSTGVSFCTVTVQVASTLPVEISGSAGSGSPEGSEMAYSAVTVSVTSALSSASEETWMVNVPSEPMLAVTPLSLPDTDQFVAEPSLKESVAS
ncbi:MAG TPA: hypothetical protein H9839_06415 [Candidatus Intestinimonas stercorigallinarum]|nr:hypothetical protein [Candidatus Intestinimonas stercorigallinarum]